MTHLKNKQETPYLKFETFENKQQMPYLKNQKCLIINPKMPDHEPQKCPIINPKMPYHTCETFDTNTKKTVLSHRDEFMPKTCIFLFFECFAFWKGYGFLVERFAF